LKCLNGLLATPNLFRCSFLLQKFPLYALTVLISDGESHLVAHTVTPRTAHRILPVFSVFAACPETCSGERDFRSPIFCLPFRIGSLGVRPKRAKKPFTAARVDTIDGSRSLVLNKLFNCNLSRGIRLTGPSANFLLIPLAQRVQIFFRTFSGKLPRSRLFSTRAHYFRASI
jgi:hypothetical protein